MGLRWCEPLVLNILKSEMEDPLIPCNIEYSDWCVNTIEAIEEIV